MPVAYNVEVTVWKHWRRLVIEYLCSLNTIPGYGKRAREAAIMEMVFSEMVGLFTDIRRKKMKMFQRALALLVCLVVAGRLPEGVLVLERMVRPPEMDELDFHDRAVSNKKRRFSRQ